MWIRSLRLNRITLLCCAVAAVAAVFVSFAWRNAVQEASTTVESSDARTDAERTAFLESCGLTVEPQPEEIKDVLIPQEFNEVYLAYQELQELQGYDLTPYCGQTVRRYSYTVTNVTDETAPVRANLLVADGKVIGGDLSSTALDGGMKGLRGEE